MYNLSLINMYNENEDNYSQENFESLSLSNKSCYGFGNSILNLPEEDYKNIEDNNPNSLDKMSNNDINISNISFCEKRTDYKTQKKQNGANISNFASQNKKIIKFTSLDDIHEIFEKNKGFTNFKDKVKKNKYIYYLECKFLKQKRKKDKNEKKCNDLDEKEINEKKNKRGRKRDPNINREVHNKMSSDNIMKNIKGKIIHYLVIFMNNILERKEIDRDKIYNINYKFINKLNKKTDLELLEKTIKDILSKDITSKIKTLPQNVNEIYIKQIENKKVIVEDFETVNFVLNMKLKDFLSLFTFKKHIDEIMKEKSDEKYSPKINVKKIEESLIGADDLLNKIYNNKNFDQQYLSSFIFHLYNYEQCFFVKAARNNR